MNNVLYLNNVIEKDKKLSSEIEMNILNNKEDFYSIVSSILKRGIDYGIKSLNIDQNSSGILDSIKSVAKGKDLKEIVKSCVNVSLSQAIENKKLNINLLKNLDTLKNVSLTGGLRFLLSAGVDIAFNKVAKLNLFKPVIEKLSRNIKSFIMSNSFIQKLESGVNKILNKTNEFKNICEKWYKAYDEFNISKINEIAKQLEIRKNKVQNDSECIKQNNIIQNITKLVNSKKDKLSNLQLQICNDL